MVFEQFTNYPRKLSPWLRISLKIKLLSILFHTLDALTLNSLLHALTETLTIEALETPPIKLWDIDRQLIKRPSLNRCQWKDFEWQLPTTEHPIHSFTHSRYLKAESMEIIRVKTGPPFLMRSVSQHFFVLLRPTISLLLDYYWQPICEIDDGQW